MFANITNNLTNLDKNSRFLLILIGIILFLLILIFIINYLNNRKIRKIEKNRRKNKKRLIEEINNAAKDIVSVKTIKKEETAINKNVSLNDNVEILEDEEILEVIEDENESDVDRILREIKEASKEEIINLNEFEREQEETAIISYDELCKKAGVKKKIYKTTKEEIKNKPKEEKKYKPSMVVSPIYGIQSDREIINIKNEEDLDQTFLTSLKEFRNTLD